MRPTVTAIPIAIVLASLLESVVGCGGPPHEVAPAHGTVTIDGRPFTHGKVMFAPLSGDGVHPGKAAMGLLQPDGSFVLSTYGNDDGAVVGEHSVTIISIQPTAAPSPATSAETGPAKDEPKFKRARAPGTFQVIAGQDNHFDIKLLRQDVTRYSTKH